DRRCGRRRRAGRGLSARHGERTRGGAARRVRECRAPIRGAPGRRQWRRPGGEEDVKPRYFEDFAEGDRIVTQGITLTDANIIDFGLRYDPQPLHIDKIAAKQGFYGGLIASGWQIASLSFRLFWQSGFIYGGSLGSPGVQDLRWLKPVRPGDTIFVEAEVTST